MRSIAIRIARILAGIAGAVVGIALLVFAGFYAASIWRESLPPGRGGEPGQYLQADGLDLHYKQWGPDNGQPILLIPGAMAWSETWAPIAELLGNNGFRVIAPDLPPFGYSERPASGDYSRQAQARRILAFADAAGLKQFVLLGHSFGGGATVEAALTQPDRISGLVLLDVALGLGRPPAKPPLAPLFSAPGLREAIMAATFTNPLMIGKGLRDFVADDDAVAHPSGSRSIAARLTSRAPATRSPTGSSPACSATRKARAPSKRKITAASKSRRSSSGARKTASRRWRRAKRSPACCRRRSFPCSTASITSRRSRRRRRPPA
jgi:pimeloyl-ACP methyl ester carboxylesterase